MTYGWAILVVLAAITALAYFGVLNAGRFLPEKCTMPSGLACIDFAATSGGITLIVSNSLGTDITNISMGINGTGCVVSQTSGPTSLNNGAQGTYVFSCSPPSGKFQGKVLITYTNEGTSLSHTKTGDLILAIP